MGQGAGGAFILSDDYTPTGNWTFPGTVTVTGTLNDTGSTLVSPVISGTVTGGASYTAPTLTAITVTGTSTGTVWVGDSNVAVDRGTPLVALDTFTSDEVEGTDLTDWYVRAGANGQGVTVTYTERVT